MIASDVIKGLQEMVEKHGDLEVRSWEEAWKITFDEIVYDPEENVILLGKP